MFFHPVRRKWVAQIYFRESNGKRRFKSKSFSTKPEADEGLVNLKAANAELAARQRKNLIRILRDKPNSVYLCPACKRNKLFKDRRIIRSEGGSIAICRRCYKENYG